MILSILHIYTSILLNMELIENIVYYLAISGYYTDFKYCGIIGSCSFHSIFIGKSPYERI